MVTLGALAPRSSHPPSNGHALRQSTQQDSQPLPVPPRMVSVTTRLGGTIPNRV